MYVSGMLFSSLSALDFNFVLILRINILLINTPLPQPSHSLVLNLFFPRCLFLFSLPLCLMPGELFWSYHQNSFSEAKQGLLSLNLFNNRSKWTKIIGFEVKVVIYKYSIWFFLSFSFLHFWRHKEKANWLY